MCIYIYIFISYLNVYIYNGYNVFSFIIAIFGVNYDSCHEYWWSRNNVYDWKYDSKPGRRTRLYTDAERWGITMLV